VTLFRYFLDIFYPPLVVKFPIKICYVTFLLTPPSPLKCHILFDWPLRPGYTNEITLTSTKIEADGDMTGLLKTDRHCLFPEENSDLRIHKEYSYLNCKLECVLNYTMNEVYAKHGQFCQPWYFPTANDSITICDPWEQFDFFNIMNNKIPSDVCNDCLPDCMKTEYNPKINFMPFDDCDLSNLGEHEFF
jgi:hypothetical protein